MEFLNRANPSTLRNEVTQILREAIVTGQLKPGDHLKEVEVAQQMKVSRSPVREGFRQLEQEGLLVSIPNQGCFVKDFSAREIRELYTIRAALENLACEFILKDNLLKDEDWERLEWYLQQQQKAIDEVAYGDLAKLDMDFHEFLVEKSGVQRLLEMWRSLRGQILILFFKRFKYMDWIPRTVVEHHNALLEALRAGEPERVVALNRSISDRVAEECVELIMGATTAKRD